MGNTAGTQMQQITSSSSGASRRNPHFSDYHIQAVSSHHLVLTNETILLCHCHRFSSTPDSILVTPLTNSPHFPRLLLFTSQPQPHLTAAGLFREFHLFLEWAALNRSVLELPHAGTHHSLRVRL
ncbi:hypothetical protein DdX_13353 [Ditylenchus destructor]|uniref:Uncharacterized protein n=1 Tax=Ditylenchus destructor TaxID=166010 RepID=A0AAD4R2W7_9BILA|nr:hypothetical protein DdX_13353 [Ditylenchus destructor]